MRDLVESVGTVESIGAPIYFYRAFGMRIHSAFPLPELTEELKDAAKPDLSIIPGSTDRPMPKMGEGVTFDFGDEVQYLAWPGVAAFRITGTRVIEVEVAAGTPMDFLAFPLLGPVMALLLHLRGLLVLHASGAEVDGRGVAFVGDKMAGKSTTVASFIRTGHRLLTDDLLAIDLSDPRVPLILPAFAQLKLAPEASDAVALEHAEKLPVVHEQLQKQQHRILTPFCHNRVRLSRIYVLDRGGLNPVVSARNGVEALKAVMRFSYLARFGRAAFRGLAEHRHLSQCAALASACQVAVLGVPDDLSRLGETVDVVRSDLSRERLRS